MATDHMVRVRDIAASLLAAATFQFGLWAVAPSAQADPIKSHQWYLTAMHADDMWKTSTGAGTMVAVIDSGVDSSLPDLQGQVLPGKDFTAVPGTAREDPEGHGTAMAALIAGTGRANDGQGGYGLAPGARILPIRVSVAPLGNNASQDWAASAIQFSKAIRYAADSDAQIINISMGIGRDTPELESAVKYAVSKNKLLFAATGNNGDTGNLVEYPAATPGVVGVGAIDQAGNPTKWSEHGPQVSLAAAGENMVHGCTGKTGYCLTQGTSDSTAIASASAALIWSAHRDWTANQVLRVMLNTAGGPTDGAKRNDYIGYGVVRPRVALTNPGDPGAADANPLFPQLSRNPATSSKSHGDQPSASQSASESATATAEKSGVAAPLWIGVGIAVVVAAVGAVVLTVRRRNRGVGY